MFIYKTLNINWLGKNINVLDDKTRLTIPWSVDNSVVWIDGFHLFGGQPVDMDRVVGAVLFAEFATDTGLDVDMDELQNPAGVLAPFHLQTLGDRTPVDAVLATGAGVPLHQRLLLRFRRLDRLGRLRNSGRR